MATLTFTAGRRPDPPALAGSALSFAACVTATQLTVLERPADPLSASLPWIWIGPLAVFLVFGIGVWAVRARGRPDWPGHAVLASATVLLAATILGCGVMLHEPLARGVCCTAAAPGKRLLAAAIGAAALLIARVTAHYRARLREQTERSRHDIEEAHTRLQHIGTHDPMTGLANRTLLKERLSQALADTRRPGRTLAIAAIDLDRFSAVNHSFGHGVGDHVLTEIAHRIESAVPHVHTLARVGGDSFAVLIDGMSARIQAQAITNAMLAALEQPLQVNGQQIRARLSIGGSLCPDDARRGDDLLAHAEAAMLGAKRSGGDRVLFFEPGMSDSMQERLALESDLRRGRSPPGSSSCTTSRSSRP